MWLWQYALLLGVLAHHSTGSKSGKAIVTEKVVIIPRDKDMKVCLYKDGHLTVYDSTANPCQCEDAVWKVLSDLCPNNNGKSDGIKIQPGPSKEQYPHSSDPHHQHGGTAEPHRGSNQNPQAFDPKNQQASSGTSNRPNTQQGVSCNAPTQQYKSSGQTNQQGTQPCRPPQVLNQQYTQSNQHGGNSEPTNEFFSGRLQGSDQYPQSFDPNNQQKASGPSNSTITQRRGPCNRSPSAIQQPQSQSFHPNNQQGVQSRDSPQVINQQVPRSSDPNNQHGAISGTGNGLYSHRPQGHNQYPLSVDPNNQQISSPHNSPNTQQRGPSNTPTSANQQQNAQSFDPSIQQGIQSPGLPQTMNQQLPRSSDQNNQHGASSGSGNGPYIGKPQGFSQYPPSVDLNNLQTSSGPSNSPETRGPCDRPTSATQQPNTQPSDPSNQQRIQSSGLPKARNQQLPQSSDQNNQHGEISGPGNGPYSGRPQGFNQYPQSVDQTNQKTSSGPYNSPNTQLRVPSNRPTSAAQQPNAQSFGPSNQQGIQSPGSPQALNQQLSRSFHLNNKHGAISGPGPYSGSPQGISQYPESIDPNNLQTSSDPSNSHNTQQRGPCNKPTSAIQQPHGQPFDSSNQQGIQSRGLPQEINQQFPLSSNQNNQPGATSGPGNGPYSGSPQYPQSVDPNNQQTSSASSNSPNIQQGGPFNRPTSATQQLNSQSFDPSSQQGIQSPGLPQAINQQFPRSSDQNNQHGAFAGPGNGPFSGRPQGFNQHLESIDPNKQASSGPPNSHNTQQRGPCNKPTSAIQQPPAQPFEPRNQQGIQSRGLPQVINHRFPLSSNQNNQPGATSRPGNGPYSGSPQYPQSVDPNNQQTSSASSNSPNIQQGGPCNRPTSATQQLNSQSFDQSSQQGIQSPGLPQAINQQFPRSSDRNNQHGAFSGPGNGPFSGRPQGFNQYLESIDPNKQTSSGPPNSHNTQQRGPCNKPTSAIQQPPAQPFEPRNQQGIQSRGLPQVINHQFPLSSNQNNQPGATSKPGNGPYSRSPQYPKSVDSNDQQTSSALTNSPNIQQRGPCNRPTSPTQQPNSQSFDPSSQQGIQSPGLRPQAMNQQFPRSSDQNNQHGAFSGPGNGPYSRSPQGISQYPESIDPNNLQISSGPSNSHNTQQRGPCNKPISAIQQPRAQPFDPSNQQGIQSRGLPQEINQQFPLSSNLNNQPGATSGPGNGPYSGSPQYPQSVDPNHQQTSSASSISPNIQQRGPCKRPTSATQQPNSQSFDPSSQQGIQSPGLPQAMNQQFSRSSDQNNQHGAFPGPGNEPYSGRPQASNQYRQLVDSNNQQTSSGPSNSPITQYPQPSDPNRHHDGTSGPTKGPYKGRTQGSTQYPQSFDPNNLKITSSQSNRPNRKQGESCNKLTGPSRLPQSSDPSNLSGTQSKEFNQQYPRSSDPHKQQEGDSGSANGPLNGRPQGSNQYPQPYVPNNQQRPSGPIISPSTQQRPCIGKPAQPQSSDPSNQQGIKRGFPQALNQQYTQSSDPYYQQRGNSGFNIGPNSGKLQGSYENPQSHDTSHQQGKSLSGFSQAINQQYPHSSDPNKQLGGNSGPTNGTFLGRHQESNQNPQSFDPNNHQRSSNGPNTQRGGPRNGPTVPSQQPKSPEPNNQQGKPTNGSPETLNHQQFSQSPYRNIQHSRNSGSTNEPYGRKYQGSDKLPQSHDPSNQQKIQSASNAGAEKNGPTQPQCSEGKKPELGYFWGHFELNQGKVKWILDCCETPKSSSLQGPAESCNRHFKSRRISLRRNPETYENPQSYSWIHRNLGSPNMHRSMQGTSYTDHIRNIIYDPGIIPPIFGGRYGSLRCKQYKRTILL